MPDAHATADPVLPPSVDALAAIVRATDPAVTLRLPDGAPPVRPSGATVDSRRVEAGDLYAALPGARHHGAQFVGEALSRGAVAVLTDETGAASMAGADVPVLVCRSPRSVLGAVAAAVHGHPDRRLTTVGVTGTNGKTTVSYLVDAGLRAAGHRTGLVGTVETRVAEEVVASVRTTPESTDVHALLARMVAAGCTAATLEVSSHALVLGRVDGVHFDVAVFTNLTQDHLDFHPDMESYFAAKAALFTPERSRRAVIDVDTDWGRRLVREAVAAGLAVTTVSAGVHADGPRETPAADWTASEVQLGPAGSHAVVDGPGGHRVDLLVGLPGPFNVSNALAALVALVEAGVPSHDAVRGIAGLPGVPGRMERVDRGQDFLALVDYAHTPDAIESVLTAVRRTVAGQVVVVVGCGGDRDPHKRPAMGAAAVAGSDVVVLTSDNPRSEDPDAILEQARLGAIEEQARQPAGARTDVVVEVDRRAAIHRAAGTRPSGGAVVVLGKGHESGQEVGGVVLPFDDREVLAEAIEALAPSHRSPTQAGSAP